MLTTRQRTVTNVVKCVVEERKVSIETATGDTVSLEADRLILGDTSVFHTQSGTMYEFDYPMNLHRMAGDDGVVLYGENVD